MSALVFPPNRWPESCAGVVIKPTGAIFSASITFNAWADFGKQLVRTHECSKWAIGDWLAFGFDRFVDGDEARRAERAERYRIALRALPHHREYGTLQNWASVCRAVEISRRREILTFSHHIEVAPYGPKKQDHYLDLAEKQDLSVADLRQLIRQAEAEIHDEPEPAPEPSPSHWTTQLSIWVGQQAPEKWSRKRLEIVDQDLAPITAFHARVRELLGDTTQITHR